jgi:hypothetical protein
MEAPGRRASLRDRNIIAIMFIFKHAESHRSRGFPRAIALDSAALQ